MTRSTYTADNGVVKRFPRARGDGELTLACPCGVVFLRWVTADAAVHDLVYTPLLVTPS